MFTGSTRVVLERSSTDCLFGLVFNALDDQMSIGMKQVNSFCKQAVLQFGLLPNHLEHRTKHKFCSGP